MKQTSQAHTLLFNTLSGVCRLLINISVLFFLTPFIIHHIGQAGFGLWSLIVATISFFDLLDVGLCLTIIKYVTQYRTEKKYELCNKVLSTSFFSYLLLAFFGSLILLCFSLVFNQIFAIDSEYRNTSLLLLIVMAFRSFFVVLPFSLFRGVLFAEQYIYLTNVIALLSSLLYAFLVWTFFSSGYGITALAFLSLACALLEYGAYAVFTYKLDPHISIRRELANLQTLQEILPFSFAQFFSHLASIILFNSDLLIIKFFLPLSDVGLYAVPLKIVTYGYMLLSQFSSTLTPLAVKTHTLEDESALRTLFYRGTKYVLIPSTMLLVAGSFFAKDLLTLWINPTYAPVASVLVVLLFSMWLSSFFGFGSDILQLTGYHQAALRYAIAGVIGNLAFSVVLVAPLGLVGVALGTLLASILSLVLNLRKLFEVYHIALREYLLNIVPIVGIPALLQLFLLSVAKTFFPPSSFFLLLMINIPALCASIVMTWFFLSDREKSHVTTLFQKRR